MRTASTIDSPAGATAALITMVLMAGAVAALTMLDEHVLLVQHRKRLRSQARLLRGMHHSSPATTADIVIDAAHNGGGADVRPTEDATSGLTLPADEKNKGAGDSNAVVLQLLTDEDATLLQQQRLRNGRALLQEGRLFPTTIWVTALLDWLIAPFRVIAVPILGWYFMYLIPLAVNLTEGWHYLTGLFAMSGIFNAREWEEFASVGVRDMLTPPGELAVIRGVR